MKQETLTRIRGKNIYTTQFDSISEMVKHCDTAAVNEKIFTECESITGNKSFTMTNNFNEARQLLQQGWTEGSTKLNKTLKLANATIQTKEVKRTIYDVVGFQASVPRYLQGIPTSMVNTKTVKKNAKIINLYKSICYSQGVSAQRIVDDSVKFLQIVQAIEKKGIRVNVYAVFHAEKQKEQMFITMKIKAANERLNISKMSFPLMHPSFLRRFIFRAMECEMRIKNDWSKGYGRPSSNDETIKLLEGKGYYIPVLISDDKAISIVDNIK